VLQTNNSDICASALRVSADETLQHNTSTALFINPLIATVKPHSNRLSYSNTVIGTLAVDGWAVTFGTATRGLGGAKRNVTAHPSTASVPTSYYLMWHYNCLWHLKGITDKMIQTINKLILNMTMSENNPIKSEIVKERKFKYFETQMRSEIVLKHLTTAPQISQTVRPFISSSLLLLLASVLLRSLLETPLGCFDADLLLDRLTQTQMRCCHWDL